MTQHVETEVDHLTVGVHVGAGAVTVEAVHDLVSVSYAVVHLVS